MRAEVIVIAVNGIGKKIHSCGDIVTPDNFGGARFNQLVKGGYIKLLGDQAHDEPANDQGDPQDEDEVLDSDVDLDEEKESGADEPANDDESAAKTNKPTPLEDKTRKEIMAELDRKKVPFDRNASKAELYELWKGIKN